MKNLPALLMILGFTFLGELLHLLLPLPVPAAIYGLVLLFAALMAGIVKVGKIKTVSDFLIGIMPVLFVAPVVNLLDSWQVAADNLLAICVILVVPTLLVFAAAGLVTQRLLKREEEHHG